MLDSLITSKTRIKLLLKFFLNVETKAYLRGLAEEFGESTNAVRVELNRLTDAGILETITDGRTKLYQANIRHSLFLDLQNIVKKFVGIDKIVEHIVAKLGDVKLAIITGDYAEGRDSGLIDLVMVGEIDKNYFIKLVDAVEMLIHRKIRALVLTEEEYVTYTDVLNKNKAIIVWSALGDKRNN
ncbi:transcriptional regulator [Desulfuribacillus stibiiarsenatis]|uniref:Transcriptional regulator n=1 Tax=Desulfuribacillus stibiiarsenatis TaxID=1390249 RepID=A0A1E5L5S3_9FIRM|nr:winged helix-turn-helix domain-containing protein [Desulfuribacillus stibiiarsenatis]OEH85480.1 transcriptional regulator [Desulfuribacillus stibiiarsenatis]